MDTVLPAVGLILGYWMLFTVTCVAESLWTTKSMAIRIKKHYIVSECRVGAVLTWVYQRPCTLDVQTQIITWKFKKWDNIILQSTNSDTFTRMWCDVTCTWYSALDTFWKILLHSHVVNWDGVGEKWNSHTISWITFSHKSGVATP